MVVAGGRQGRALLRNLCVRDQLDYAPQQRLLCQVQVSLVDLAALGNTSERTESLSMIDDVEGVVVGQAS